MPPLRKLTAAAINTIAFAHLGLATFVMLVGAAFAGVADWVGEDA